MNLVVKREELAAALKLVVACIDRRVTLPILGHVLLEEQSGQLAVCASDLDREVTVMIESKEPFSGGVAIEGAALSAIASRSAGEFIMLEVGEDRVSATSGHSHYSLPFLPERDFPRIGFSDREEASIYWLTDGGFQAAVAQTTYAVAETNIRPYLTGLHIHAAGTNWCCVSSDGHRFARAEFKGPALGEGLTPFMLPLKSAELTVKLLGEGDIFLRINDRKACFTGSKASIVTKLLEVKFPDYTRRIPNSASYVVEVDRKELQDAMWRIAPFTGGNGINVTCTDGNMVISASSKNEEASDVIPCSGSIPFKLSIADTYLSEAITILKGDSITLNFTEKGGPVILKNQDGQALHLVMPRLV